MKLKEENKDLKILLTLGEEWNGGFEDFSIMVADKDRRSHFIKVSL